MTPSTPMWGGGSRKQRGQLRSISPATALNCDADFLTFTQVQVRGTERVLLFFFLLAAQGCSPPHPSLCLGSGRGLQPGEGASHETEKRKVFLEQIQTQDNHVTKGK